MSETRNILIASAISLGILMFFQTFFDPKLNVNENEIVIRSENDQVGVTSIKPKIVKQCYEIQNDKVKAVVAVDAENNVYIDQVELKGIKNVLNSNENVKIFDDLDNADERYFMIQSDDDFTKTLVKNENNVLIITQLGSKIDRIITISLDDKYMFKLDSRLINKTKQVISSKVQYKLYKKFITDSSAFSIHEGLVGYSNGSLIEKSFDKMIDNPNERFIIQSKGWAGLTSKYFISAISSDSVMSLNTVHTENADFIEYSTGEISLNPSEASEQIVYMFTGPKSVDLLDRYKVTHSFDKFDLAIDFGMFYFITRPLLHFLKLLSDITSNMGLAIILLTFLLKVLFFPLSRKSNVSMARMKQLQPKIDNIRAAYGEDKKKINSAIAELYQKEKVNPASGCMPMILQIPIFFSLYKVLSISVEMRHAAFVGWIHDLAAPDPTSFLNLFGLLDFELPNMLKVGIWPILMGLTMVWQQKITPTSGDDMQKKMAMMLPVVFTFMLAQFPVGIVVYWCFSNIFTILQQMIFNKMLIK